MIIGINGVGVRSSSSPLRYAELDASAIRDALTDPRTGTFDSSDVTLFVGPSVRADEVKKTLRQIALSSDESDVLLIYFAGHTLEPSWSHHTELYLVTPDLDESALSEHPDAGLRMTFLTRDVLPLFKGTSVVVLDCCQAGSLGTFQGADLVGFGGREDPRHGMLAACAAGEYTRENSDLKHGVFTHHVLAGLGGGAADNRGSVTFETLSAYVGDLGLDPRPIVLLRARETILLTRPGMGAHHAERPPLPPAPDRVLIKPLGNSLDRHVPDLIRLINRLEREAQTPSSAGHVERVEYVRSALGSGGVAHLGPGEDGYVPLDITRGLDIADVRSLLPSVDYGARLPVGRRGYGHVATDGRRTLWCAPLGPGSGLRLLAVVDPPEWLVNLGEVGAKVLQSIWDTDFAASPDESKLQVLTALRSAFGRLPEELFELALHLYREVMSTFCIVFQPVVTIGESAHHIGVHSYEALARRSSTEQGAPFAMLKLAHVWGDHFVIERDKSILTKALSAYKSAHADSPWSADVPKPVSVNVSVRSLLDDSYIDTLCQLISDLELHANAITLEISEQDAIEPWAGEQWSDAPHTYFNNRLAAITRDVGVVFALDDFGVGHASLSRMAELPLTHIKVDRSILHHKLAIQELELVVKVARDAVVRGEAHTARAVVMEGVDDQSPVSLREIYSTGIRHVQGYITGERGSLDLHYLDPDIRRELADRVRGDDENRPTALARGDRPQSRPPLRRSA